MTPAGAGRHRSWPAPDASRCRSSDQTRERKPIKPVARDLGAGLAEQPLGLRRQRVELDGDVEAGGHDRPAARRTRPGPRARTWCRAGSRTGRRRGTDPRSAPAAGSGTSSARSDRWARAAPAAPSRSGAARGFPRRRAEAGRSGRAASRSGSSSSGDGTGGALEVSCASPSSFADGPDLRAEQAPPGLLERDGERLGGAAAAQRLDAHLRRLEGSDLQELAAEARGPREPALEPGGAQRDRGHVAAVRTPDLPVRRQRRGVKAFAACQPGIRVEVTHRCARAARSRAGTRAAAARDAGSRCARRARARGETRARRRAAPRRAPRG